jgi:hypothetical protein
VFNRGLPQLNKRNYRRLDSPAAAMPECIRPSLQSLVVEK